MERKAISGNLSDSNSDSDPVNSIWIVHFCCRLRLTLLRAIKHVCFCLTGNFFRRLLQEKKTFMDCWKVDFYRQQAALSPHSAKNALQPTQSWLQDFGVNLPPWNAEELALFKVRITRSAHYCPSLCPVWTPTSACLKLPSGWDINIVKVNNNCPINMSIYTQWPNPMWAPGL